MKYKEAERVAMLESLRWSLESVKHTGMMLVWTYSYLTVYYAKVVGNNIVCSRATCVENTDEIHSLFINALADFRNTYVHEGAKGISGCLSDIIKYTDYGVVSTLFSEVGIPQNAVDLFWNWYSTGTVN